MSDAHERMPELPNEEERVFFQIIGIVETGAAEQPFHLQGQPEVRVADFAAGSIAEAIGMFERAAEEAGERVVAVTGVGEGQ
jgi:hypothetical protein